MPNVLADVPLFAGWLPKRLADETGPHRQRWAGGTSAGAHAIALLLFANLVAPAPARKPLPELNVTTPALTFSLKDLPLVFTPAVRPGGGGGGGGAHQRAPVPKAHGRGDDPITLPTTREPVASSPLTGRELPFQMIDIPAKPLASGTEVIVGLPAGVEGAPPSRGPGSGGGVGEGPAPAQDQAWDPGSVRERAAAWVAARIGRAVGFPHPCSWPRCGRPIRRMHCATGFRAA